MDILEKLVDLHKQATTEQSHYYVAACCKEAMEEISQLRLMVGRLRQEMQSLRGVVNGTKNRTKNWY
jgi:hypothetical protein